jgi:enoyl-CoA hydratase
MRTFHTHFSDHILTVTLSRPKALNALNLELLDGISDVILELCQNDDTKGLILIGDGDKSFVAGADIKEIGELSTEQAHEFSRKGQEIFERIATCPKPVVAAVNGFALGGGCELAMACHIRLATENATFGLPETTLGLIPGYGGTQRLPQLVGRGKALEMMLTGEPITAKQAFQAGLVNHVVATRDELLSQAVALLKKIIANGPVAVANVIKSVNAGHSSEREGYQAEAENFAACAATEDFREGIEAFLQKRKVKFTGK